uniref:(northern house mosquito) hypothetical protein n=2 Tax=Culex pipiens TaxID=7175 RepID=A0A8D8C4W4_CULPI
MLLDSDLIVNLLENFIALRFGNRFFVWQMLYQWLPCSPLPCSHFESPNCRAHDCCFCSFRSQKWHLLRDRISSLGQRSQAQLKPIKNERRTKLNFSVQSLTGYSWSNTSGTSPQSARKSPFPAIYGFLIVKNGQIIPKSQFPKQSTALATVSCYFFQTQGSTM